MRTLASWLPFIAVAVPAALVVLAFVVDAVERRQTRKAGDRNRELERFRRVDGAP